MRSGWISMIVSGRCMPILYPQAALLEQTGQPAAPAMDRVTFGGWVATADHSANQRARKAKLTAVKAARLCVWRFHITASLRLSCRQRRAVRPALSTGRLPQPAAPSSKSESTVFRVAMTNNSWTPSQRRERRDYGDARQDGVHRDEAVDAAHRSGGDGAGRRIVGRDDGSARRRRQFVPACARPASRRYAAGGELRRGTAICDAGQRRHAADRSAEHEL